MSVKVKQIETIYLPVSDPKSSAEWYESYLGLALRFPVEASSTQAQLALSSGQSLVLIQSKDKINANFIEVGGTEQCVFTLEVEDFDSFYQEMKAKGATLSNVEDNDACGSNFYLYDLDGNKLDIWSGWPSQENKEEKKLVEQAEDWKK